MKDDVSSETDTATTVENRRAIDTFLDSVRQLSHGQVSHETFYAVLLSGAGQLLRARAGIAWQVSDRQSHDMSPQPQAVVDRSWDVDQLLRSQELESIAREADRISQISGSTQSMSCLGDPDHRLTTLVATYSSATGHRQALAFYIRHSLPPDAATGCLRFVASLAQLAEQFHLNSQTQQKPADSWRELELLIRKLRSSRSSRDIAYELANDVRRMVDCDRVFVLLHQTGRYRAVACSGIDWIDRHAPLAADLEKLVTAVAPLKRAWSTDGDLRSVEPEIHRHLEPYLDQSTVRHLALVPMMPAGDLCDGNSELPIGIFAFENLVDRPVVHDTALISAVAHHAEAALVEMSQRETLLVRAAIGLTSPWRVWFRTRRVSKWLLAIMVGVAVVGGAMMWPVTFQVRAEGELVPDSRKYVFASHNGFLDEIFVSHGDKVIAGQPVARISSPELELEARRLLGELQTTQEQLAATTAERFQVTGVDQRSVQRAGELTAQEGSLKEQELSLTEQLAIVKRQEDQLLLRSDISGVVVDWNLQQRLVRRPVQRGQVVLQIADLSGPWSLELRVPDESAGHVLKATESSAEPLAVTFVVNQDPEVTHVGTLRDRSTTTENPQDGSAYVEMQVAFPQDRVMTRRTDAQVTAKIHCGRRRLGFVLFHEVVEELRRTFF